MNHIKQLREQRGMTQKALAKAANVSGPFVYDLENGNRNAKPETLQRIADALGCSVGELQSVEGDVQDEACGC